MLDAALDLFLGSACAACGRPGRALCRACDAALPSQAVVSMPTPTPTGLATVLAAGEYDGSLKAMVNAHKERGRLALARPLGSLLAISVSAVAPAGPVVLVPVPSRRVVVRRRGHDPLLRITREAAARLRRDGRVATVAQPLIVVRRVVDQSGLDAGARRENLQGVLRSRPFVPRGQVIVVDDVVTTGATVREAQRALEAANIPVAGIAAVAATRKRTSLPLHPKGD